MIDSGYVAAGALTGVFVGLTGVGGGALMTPVLLLVFGVPPMTAIATDLWFAAITKLAGAAIHHDGGQVDWQVARRLWSGSLPMALAIVGYLGWGGSIGKVGWLTYAVGFVVLLTAIGLLVAPKLYSFARNQRLANPARFKAAQPFLTMLSGTVLGLCVALTSVGAGALGSVLLLYLYPLRMTPHRLVATDLVHAIPLAIVAGIGYLVAGMVDWKMLISLLLGSLPAVVVGSLVARKVPSRVIQLFLAILLLLTGLKTVFS